MKRLIPALALSFALAACVDTTGLSAELSRGPHPKTNADSTIVVTEFADLQCPACMAAHTQIVKPLIEKYGTRIRFDFVHHPLRSLHRFALDAAEASECAADENKFWEFEELAFTNQPQMSKETIREWAQSLGLDMEKFDRCTQSHIKKKAILAEYETGRTAGVTGTPTFFVNGQKVNSSLEEISKAIDGTQATAKPKL